MQRKAARSQSAKTVTAATYQVPEGEEKLYHVKIEVKKFNENSGERLSIPRVQKFGYKGYKTIAKNLKKQGYALEVLHDPTDWMKQQAEKRNEAATQKAENAKARKEAERQALKQSLLDELRDELKADVMAELKADAKAAKAKAAKAETGKADAKADAKQTEAKK